MMTNENKETGGYVHLPDGSKVIVVRDENQGTASQPTEEDDIDLRVYWHTFSKHKWIILGLTLVIGSLTALKTLSLPPIYQAKTALLIEFDQANVISIKEMYGSSRYQQHMFYNSQLKILKYRGLAEKVVDKLNLVSHPAFYWPPPSKGFFYYWHKLLSKVPWLLVSPPKEPQPLTAQNKFKAVVGRVMANLNIASEPDSQIINISFDSTHPQLAATVPNTLAEVYIETDLEAKLAMTSKGSEWLTQRINNLRQQLKVSEQDLQRYIESQGLVNVAGVKTIATKQIEETAAELVHASIKLTKLKNVYRQVQQVGNSTTKAFESTPAIFNHPLVQGLKQIELDIEKKVSEMNERYGPKHPHFIAAKAELKAAKEHTNAQIKKAIIRISKEYELAFADVKALERSLEDNKRTIREINRKEYQLSVLERDVEVHRQLYELFLTRFKETDASQDIQVLQSTVGRVVEQAIAPSRPYKPKTKFIIIISLVFGFIFSTLLAYLLEYINNTLKDGEEVEHKLGLPLLGSLPKIKIGNKEEHKPAWLFLKEPKSQFAESVRTIRTGIMLSGLDTPHKVLVVTSSVPGEGKSTSAINQALALGQMAKTLLIDADMRRPSIAKSFGLSNKTPGLSELVARTQTLDECIHHLSGEQGGIDVISSGEVPPNPLELLSSERFNEVLEQLAQDYEYIVIDTAPIMLVSDALVLAKHASGVLYIVKANVTPYQVVQDGLKRLRQVKAPVHNIILNQVDTRKHSKHYYGKYSYYKGYYGKDGYYSDTA
ncbi:MAG: polysaccharide biosynthesis tyrosine autokinase [Pseudomonadota bacterium]